MKKTLVSLVSLAGAAALLLSGGCMNVAKKMQEADAAYKNGRHQEACDITAKVLKKEPRNVSAMVLNGWSLHQLRRDREAGIVLAQAVQTAPTDFSAQYFYGCLLADNEDYANALPPLREAYRLNADCEPLLVLLARCCIEQNLPEGVKYLQILRKYPDMQAGPNSIALANNLGCLLTNTGNYDRATNAFNEAWAKDPQDFVPPQNLAVLYDQYRKDPRKALSYYRASEKAALAAGNTVKVDSYKTRIAALERENPHTPPAVKPHGTTAPKTGAKTTPKAGTTGKTTSSKTGAKTTSKTGTTSKPTAKKTTSTTLAH